MFQDKIARFQHYRAKHRNERLTYNVCGFDFWTMESLNNHKGKRHGHVKSYATPLNVPSSPDHIQEDPIPELDTMVEIVDPDCFPGAAGVNLLPYLGGGPPSNNGEG